MLFGALLAGAVGDIVGRRRVMLTDYAWFFIGMAVTAFMHTTATFGVVRPFYHRPRQGGIDRHHRCPGRRDRAAGKEEPVRHHQLFRGAAGSLLGSFLAIVLLDSVGRRGLFLVGALPLVTLLPMAFCRLPESVTWLVANGQPDKARAVSARTGLPMPGSVPQQEKAEKVGFAGLFGRGFWFATVITGLMSALAQCLNYFLSTWLPVLMEQVGSIFYILTGLAVLGVILTLLVPCAHRADGSRATPVEPTLAVGTRR
jgi:AAHS family benzoate transporter-like MFS transporter